MSSRIWLDVRQNKIELSAVNGYTRVVQGFHEIGFVMNIVTVDSATCIVISISAYSLLGGGFHSNNGLDVETIVHSCKIYISPVLLDGLELILPTTSSLLLLENFQKNS